MDFQNALKMEIHGRKWVVGVDVSGKVSITRMFRERDKRDVKIRKDSKLSG